MAQDYAKLKNAELENLLKQRSLPHTGKKADLVARLQEDDAKQATSTDDNLEEELNWEVDAAFDEATGPAGAPQASGLEGAADAPTMEQPAGAEIAQSETAKVDGNPPTTIEVPTTSDDAIANQAAVAIEPMEIDVDAEVKARIARIDKFTNSNDPDSVKWAEDEKAKIRRLQKQGAQDFAKEKLTSQASDINKALPVRRERGDKRKRGPNDEGSGRGGRDRRGGGGAGRGRGGRESRRHHPYSNSRRGDRRDQNTSGGRKSEAYPGWMSEADRARADARKGRWA